MENRQFLYAIMIILSLQLLTITCFETISYIRWKRISEIVKENDFFEYVEYSGDISFKPIEVLSSKNHDITQA